MAKEQAAEFLVKLVTDPKLQATVRANYRQMLCDIARKTGLVFSAQELQQAVAEGNCRLTDDMLYEVVGGVGDVCNWTGTGGGIVNTTTQIEANQIKTY